jgi:hypothetical protein
LRDELRIVLGRDQVQWVRAGRRLTLRGIEYRIKELRTIPSAGGAAARHWEPVMRALAAALAAMEGKPARAEVVLSNHYMRYAMVANDVALSNAAEELAYARHLFVRLYGAEAEGWECRVDRNSEGGARLACAVDGGLMQALSATFAGTAVRLASVQPQLMKAYNNSHAELGGQRAWFVQQAEGKLCIGVVSQGGWCEVRSVRAGEGWLEMLPEIIDREACLMGMADSPEQVCLWSPELAAAALPRHERWQFRMLQPVIRPGFADGYDARFAVALCG